MTINYSQSLAVSQQSNSSCVVRSPTGTYTPKLLQKDTQDQLEEHLAMVQFYQMALLELARSKAAPDSADWEYGAYLLGTKLQQQGESLLQQLSAKPAKP